MDTQNNSNIFSDYTLEQSGSHAASKSFISNVFIWMFGALLVSAGFAYLFATNATLLSYLVGERGLTGLGKIALFAPLGFVMLMSFGFNRLSAPALIAAFFAYAAINGITFSFILIAFTPGSVVSCFLSSAAMFGIMAVMGYTTSKDLTSFGRILMMGAIGLVVAMIINWFMHSSGLNYLISVIGVAVFTGLTAYDVQKLKRIGAGLEYQDVPAVNVKKLSIMGALNLYLDFINIFLFMLRLFGNRR